MKLSQTTEKKIKKEINSDKELIELKKTIFDEAVKAVNVRLDYEENPSEESESLIRIHQDSEFLKEE